MPNTDDVNFYQIESKSTDEDFLSGKAIICEAVIPVSEYLSGMLQPGERIVVLLSTGKKYMGEVLSFNYHEKAGLAEGKLEIIRHIKK